MVVPWVEPQEWGLDGPYEDVPAVGPGTATWRETMALVEGAPPAAVAGLCGVAFDEQIEYRICPCLRRGLA
jgi:hypothetical protein